MTTVKLRFAGRLFFCWLSFYTVLPCLDAQIDTLHVIKATSLPVWISGDSVSSPGYIAKQITYRTRYSFIDYSRNFIQWQQPGAVGTFFAALKNAANRKVRVVHIGDSHVQADIYTGFVRSRLQQIFGMGGRGMVFPYAAAHTHAAFDYKTYAFGNWQSARNVGPPSDLPLGLSGATVRTADTAAGFRIVFSDASLVQGGQRLKLYCSLTPAAYDLKLDYGTSQPLLLGSQADSTRRGLQPYLEVVLPLAPDYLDIRPVRSGDLAKNSFECYGISLESLGNSGLLYTSVGINGAGFGSILKEQLLPQQLDAEAPDLVVIDLGGNEYYVSGLNPTEYEHKLRATIALVRQGAPNASILVSCSQDMYRRRYDVLAAKTASEIARRVAFDANCAFYDYYDVAGGPTSMLKWRTLELAKRDFVHLTFEGYITKAELFTDALLAGYYQSLTGAQNLLDTTKIDFGNPPTSTLLIADMHPKVGAPQGYYQQKGFKKSAYTPLPETATPAGNKQIYTVRTGDNLGAIAERHHVSLARLKGWNNLASNLIYPGQRLVVYTAMPVPPGNLPAVATPPPATLKPGTAKHSYLVKSGDNLWTIAKANHTTVETLQELNGAAVGKLRPGQKLWVP